jgi:phosphomannomutase
LCDGSVMVTASHLPSDRNGMKFFTTKYGGFQKNQIRRMIGLAQDHAQIWFNMGIIPPSSGPNAVFCNEFVHWMPYYQQQLETKLLHQVGGSDVLVAASTTSSLDSSPALRPLEGLKIVLNSGNGSGGFFQQVLQSLGANVDGSINVTPDPTFPQGIPNPENEKMVDATIRACELAHADLGILLDTDADRCGLVAPRQYSKHATTDNDSQHQQEYQPTDYEPINKNRLIALMGVIYARQSPGCAIVTDSVTSNGLATFLEKDLGLTHIRYLRGYANVIQKAKSIIELGIADAEVAIETSGHCAVRENGFLDDGTFTAVKVLGLLAQERMKEGLPSTAAAAATPPKSLLDLISNLQELDEVIEFRLPVLDGSAAAMGLFDFVALEIEALCDERGDWTVDRANLEGIRISTGESGGYFLLRKSLHDPVFCLQVEAPSKDDAKQSIVQPLLQMIHSESRIATTLDTCDLEQYVMK